MRILRFPTRGVFCASLILLAGVQACPSEQKQVEDSSKAVARREKAKLPQVSPQGADGRATSAGPPTVRLTIDGSLSMAGYTNCQAHPTGYDDVLDRLMVDLSVADVQRFGAGSAGVGRVEPVANSRTLHCPEFYNQQQNPDYALYDDFASDSSTVVNLYATDGVQSDLGGGNQSPSVTRLVQWLQGGRALAILAFRSEFAGRAWSESRKQWIGNIDVTERPFYVFAFARSEAELDQALGKLSPAITQRAVVMRFDQSSVACTVAPGKVGALTADRELPWVMLAPSVSGAAKTKATPVAAYGCSIAPGFPYASIRPRIAEWHYGQWNGTNLIFPVSEPAGARIEVGAATAAPTGSAATIDAVTGDDPATRYGFFVITLQADVGDLRPQVASLSSDSDAEADDFGRTYRIDWVIEQLARARLARSVAPGFASFTTTFK